MKSNLTVSQFESVRSGEGEPFHENLIKCLGAFKDPYEAVAKEIREMRKSLFIPDRLITHGLVYDLVSGGVDIVVDGYEN